MADHTTSTPEPVLTRARVVKAVTAATPVVFALATALGIRLTLSQSSVLEVGIAAAGVVAGTVNFSVAHVQALRVRALVTPTSAPTSATGEQLVSLSTARAMARRAAAAATVADVAAAPLPVGTPEPTPWESDSTLVSVAA